MKTRQAISGTSAATYKVMEPHYHLLTINTKNSFPLISIKLLTKSKAQQQIEQIHFGQCRLLPT